MDRGNDVRGVLAGGEADGRAEDAAMRVVIARVVDERGGDRIGGVNGEDAPGGVCG